MGRFETLRLEGEAKVAAYADIVRALFARVETLVTGSPSLPFVLPEPTRTFVPPADGKYLEVAFHSNRPAWEGLSEGRLDQGLLQVTVIWPKNKGVLAPVRIADEIIAHFPLAHEMFHGSAKVKVTRQPWMASPLVDPSEVRIPVTIPWAA